MNQRSDSSDQQESLDERISPAPILVSACLLGVRCRYDGAAKADQRVLQLVGRVPMVPVCPEQLGGLPTPRIPHERRGDKVISRQGHDGTEAFERGAVEALRIAHIFGCRTAVLKARSPSCGHGMIYDGTFSGKLVPGDGVFAEKAIQAGIRVLTEEQVERLGEEP